MKHCTTRLLALLIALAITGGVLCVSAANNADNRVCDLVQESGYTLTLLDTAGNAITAVTDQVGESEKDVYRNVAKVKVNFTGEAGKEYVVFLLSGGSLVPQSGNIAYIDQKSGETNMEFVVYPSMLAEGTDYIIRISSVDGMVTAGSFSVPAPEYIMGDTDSSGSMDVGDVTLLLRYIVGLIQADDPNQPIELRAADVDNSGTVDVGDAVKMLRVLVGLDAGFEQED